MKYLIIFLLIIFIGCEEPTAPKTGFGYIELTLELNAYTSDVYLDNEPKGRIYGGGVRKFITTVGWHRMVLHHIYHDEWTTYFGIEVKDGKTTKILLEEL